MKYSAISMLKWIALVEKAGKMYGESYSEGATTYGKLSKNHIPYVVEIIENPGVTQDKLREIPILHPSNISRALHHLEKEGFITRAPLESDKRTNCLYPTDKAKDLASKLQKRFAGWHEIILEGLPEHKKAVFYKIMEKISANAEDYIKKHIK